jgi:hypothetical protein
LHDPRIDTSPTYIGRRDEVVCLGALLRGSPNFVRLGLDRLRSPPHSVAVIDTFLRGRLAPRASPRANLDRDARG